MFQLEDAFNDTADYGSKDCEKCLAVHSWLCGDRSEAGSEAAHIARSEAGSHEEELEAKAV